jgi:hypothetical protein
VRKSSIAQVASESQSSWTHFMKLACHSCFDIPLEMNSLRKSGDVFSLDDAMSTTASKTRPSVSSSFTEQPRASARYQLITRTGTMTTRVRRKRRVVFNFYQLLRRVSTFFVFGWGWAALTRCSSLRLTTG